MRTKSRTAVKLNKEAHKHSISSTSKSEGAEFLPLEGGPGGKLEVQNLLEDNATVLYVGRIPDGFTEEGMRDFFKEFGTVKRLRISRSRKTGKSKHYGFVEFESPMVAKIVAETMNNHLVENHLLQVHPIPTERVHPNLWKAFSFRSNPLDWLQLERQRLNKERTLDEHQKLVERIKKRDQSRRKQIEAVGLDYKCPEIVGDVLHGPKKIKFEDD